MFCCGFSSQDFTVTMMTSWNVKIFRAVGPFGGEFTGNRWIPLTKATDAEHWYFISSAPDQTVEQTMWIPVIWNAIALIMASRYCPLGLIDWYYCKSTIHVCLPYDYWFKPNESWWINQIDPHTTDDVTTTYKLFCNAGNQYENPNADALVHVGCCKSFTITSFLY